MWLSVSGGARAHGQRLLPALVNAVDRAAELELFFSFRPSAANGAHNRKPPQANGLVAIHILFIFNITLSTLHSTATEGIMQGTPYIGVFKITKTPSCPEDFDFQRARKRLEFQEALRSRNYLRSWTRWDNSTDILE